MMLSLGILLGAVFAAPVFFALGRFERADRRIVHEVGPSLYQLRAWRKERW